MTAEAQRIAIALAYGWTDVRYESNYFVGRSTPRSTLRGNNHKGNRWEIPDYLNDLNACHEFEKFLTNEQRRDYEFAIFRAISMGRMNIPIPTLYDFDMIHATAAQRCEAFLKTINKWANDN